MDVEVDGEERCWIMVLFTAYLYWRWLGGAVLDGDEGGEGRDEDVLVLLLKGETRALRIVFCSDCG